MTTDELIFFFFILGTLTGALLHKVLVDHEEPEYRGYQSYTPYDWEDE